MDWLWSIWYGARSWLSLGVSSFVPRRRAVPQVTHPEQLLPVIEAMRLAYRPDPVGGVVDFSYDPRIVEFYYAINRLDLIPYLDCDDAGYRIWAGLLTIATNIAMVLLVDAGPLSHVVVCFDWGDRRWAIDYTGLHDLTGTTVGKLYGRLVPGSAFIHEQWFRTYPFPDPRRA